MLPGANNGPGQPHHGAASSSLALHQDRFWLAAFRRGEPAALAAVFRAYIEVVLRTLRAGIVVRIDGIVTRLSASHDVHDIENIAQETFARAFAPSARQAYDGQVDYGGYLATIARNLAIDLARRRQREKRTFVVVEDISLLSLEGGQPNQEQRAADAELRAIMDGFRAELGAFDQRLFAERFDKGGSLRKVAQALGTSVSKIRRVDARLRTRLVAVLRRAGYLDGTGRQAGRALKPETGGH